MTAAGDAIHAGISVKDAIVMTLTGATSKARDHAKAARALVELATQIAGGGY